LAKINFTHAGRLQPSPTHIPPKTSLLASITLALFKGSAMKTLKTTALLLTACCSLGLGLHALAEGDARPARHDGEHHPHHHPLFERADANNDGVVTLAEALAAIPEDAPATAAERVTALFSEIDANDDGQLTLEEVDAFRENHPHPLFERADANNDGVVTLEEALAAIPEGAPEDAAERVTALFGEIDANNDGQLTLEEVHAFRKNHPRPLFERADANDDGVVTLEEAQAAIPDGAPEDAREHLTAFFTRIDTNQDGQISREEADAARAEHRERCGPGCGERGDRPERGGRPAAARFGRGSI
jgi:Ca2+-binding EF-hand superfamily protein